MAATTSNGNATQLLVVGTTGGITVVDPATPLKRLNYFDGKFLRAADMDVEQSYLRQLVAISNQGLGGGVVYGYDTVLASGDQIQIGPGLAIDPAGKVLLLQHTVVRGITELIEASRKQIVTRLPDASGKTGADAFSDCIEVVAPPPGAVVPVSDIYVIAICTAEALCGTEDVYGKLCELACITSTDRPYRLDGIVVRAIPLQLVTPFPTSKTVAIDSNLYLRSKIAHSHYADEIPKHPNAISRDGLLSTTWCLGAGYDSSCCEVPLAVIARAGATTIFLDAWIARRERGEAPSRRYWQWKMMMRPWNVFLAQVLQFQCQLGECLSGLAPPRTVDPCASQNQALGDAVKFLEDVRAGLAGVTPEAGPGHNGAAGSGLAVVAAGGQPMLPGLSFTRIADLKSQFETILKSAAIFAQPTDRILIRGGMIELPSAGYLPVVNGTNQSVNAQVYALLGEGLDLRFCIVTADYVAHAFEEAQHMNRISLIEGLDDPLHKPKVDILVPDGSIAGSCVSPAAGLYDAALVFSTTQTGGYSSKGTAREAALPSGGTVLYSAGVGRSEAGGSKLLETLASVFGEGPANPEVTPDLASNPFVQLDPLLAPNFATRLANAVEAARSRIAAAGLAAASTAAPPAAEGAPASVAVETIDGFWLTLRTDSSVKNLAPSGQTQVSGRFITAQSTNPPIALEVAFHGALTVQSARADRSVINAAANLIISLAILTEPAPQEETKQLITKRVNWQVTLSYSGDDNDGSITVDLMLPGSAQAFLRLRRARITSGTSELYEILLPAPATPPPANPFLGLARLALTADASVLQPQNPNHALAEDGLILVQAAVIETESTFRSTAEAWLFPALPTATSELIIQALRDWVLFTRRREEQCGFGVPPPPPPPPRTYRIFNILAENPDAGQSQAQQLVQVFADPTRLAVFVQEQLGKQKSAGRDFIVTFAGDSAQPLFDLAAAEADWKLFQPGDKIFFAAAGERADNDAALQLSRIRTFETAISADSTEDPSAIRFPIVPLPDAAVAPDADGIMFFLTAVSNTSEQVYTVMSDHANQWKELTGSIPNSSVGIIGQLMALAGATQIGTVNFRGETTTIADTSAENIKTQLQGKVVEDMAVWAKANDPRLALREQQASAFRTALSDLVQSNVLLKNLLSQADVIVPGGALPQSYFCSCEPSPIGKN